MRSFASDNNSGVHPRVMEALTKANRDHALGYGDDPWTREAEEKVREVFGEECRPYFVFNGTGSNVIALQLMTRSFQSVICAKTAHIYVDECGAPVKMTGCQIIPLESADGKLTPGLIESCLHVLGDPHHSQPGAVYLSQCTELGTVYTPGELRAITGLAHAHGLYVHMDGARIANAAAALGVSLREMTAGCGIDVLSFGGTKNGLMMGECIVVFNPVLADTAPFFRKQSSQLASKMRFLSCQFTAYLTDGLWLENACRANEMARLLHAGLSRFPRLRFTQKVESNQLFLTMPRELARRMLESYFFYYWNEADGEIRLVTSFDTTEADVRGFLDTLEAAGKDL